MVQVKKESVRQAILDSAYARFSKDGYHSATLQQIAEGAGISVSSLYSYFTSKLQLLYEVVGPWHMDAFAQLENKVSKLSGRREKLRAIFLGIWRDIPIKNMGLANSLMQALSTADPARGKPVPLLRRLEDLLLSMLREVVPDDAAAHARLDVMPNIIIMAYDGFVINRRLKDIRDIERMADAMCDLILGEAGQQPNAARKPEANGCAPRKLRQTGGRRRA